MPACSSAGHLFRYRGETTMAIIYRFSTLLVCCWESSPETKTSLVSLVKHCPGFTSLSQCQVNSKRRHHLGSHLPCTAHSIRFWDEIESFSYGTCTEGRGERRGSLCMGGNYSWLNISLELQCEWVQLDTPIAVPPSYLLATLSPIWKYEVWHPSMDVLRDSYSLQIPPTVLKLWCETKDGRWYDK